MGTVRQDSIEVPVKVRLTLEDQILIHVAETNSLLQKILDRLDETFSVYEDRG